MEVDYEGIMDVGKNNSEFLTRLFYSHASMDDFLEDEDLHLPVHPTNVTPLEREVLIERTYDIDGMVVELKSLRALKNPLHYLLLKIIGLHSLSSVYHLLKKHLSLSEYSNNGLKCLKNIQGLHIGYMNGWRISVCLLPRSFNGTNTMENIERTRNVCLEYFQNVQSKFVNCLQNLSPEDMNRPTIKKNCLSDTSSMNILPQDQDFIMGLLDKALAESIRQVSCLKIVIIASKFGQKQEEQENLGQLFHTGGISTVSIHTACNLSAEVYHLHLLWARHGLQELVGDRGQLFSCLSMAETANFQTNLDNRLIDVSGDLRRVAKYPTNLNFIQLYSDTPHHRDTVSGSHPASGVITCCGILHPRTTVSMKQKSNRYLQNMEDNVRKLTGYIACRLEIVSKVTIQQIGESFNARDMFDDKHLDDLVENHSMLVPFHESPLSDKYKFIGIVQRIANYLCQELCSLVQRNADKGGFICSWKSYELELALETFFWGRPRTPTDVIYCINLGPDASVERSMTSQRGILGLCPVQSAALPGSPPPLHHWTKSEIQMRRVKRIFEFADCLQASDVIIGRNLINIVLGDLYDPVLPTLHDLKQDRPPTGYQCTGGITTEQLSQELCQTRRFKYPCTFKRATDMLDATSGPLNAILLAGLNETGLKYFPALKTIDAGRNPRVSWNGRHVWQILSADMPASALDKVQLVTNDVIISMESKRLTFSRNLQPFRDNGMPWIEAIIKRLEKQKLSHKELVHVCTFLSAIAFIQQGIYINFVVLGSMEMNLPVKQFQLKLLQIQSKFLLPAINVFKAWRLHEDIPIKLTKEYKIQPAKHAQWVKYTEEDIPLDELDDVKDTEDGQNVVRLAVVNLPAHFKRAWSSRECSMLNDILKGSTGLTRKEMYEKYIKLCSDNSIAARTFSAFKQKIIQFT